MPDITFIQANGESVVVSAELGDNLMQVARDNDVEGILAECGGAVACATCHCVPEENLRGSLPEKSDQESMILQGAFNVEDGSRLACQLNVSAEMDGATFNVPEGIY